MLEARSNRRVRMPEPLKRGLSLLVTIALASIVAFGVVTDEATPAERLDDLGARIACPVCNGSSIGDSPSTYARDMLAVVEEQIDAGRSDDEILAYFEARYTESIRLDAPSSGNRIVLWIAPFLVGAVGVFAALGTRRREASK